MIVFIVLVVLSIISLLLISSQIIYEHFKWGAFHCDECGTELEPWSYKKYVCPRCKKAQ